jgi:TRAP-type C4-dicarboxylate transport system permease small subunit
VTASPAFYVFLAAMIAASAVVRAVLYRRQALRGLFGVAGRLEVGVIAILLLAMVLLGCMQIVLRNFFHSGVLWVDPLMRHLVLWLGCLGAALATTRIRHINIDVFTRLIPRRQRGYRRAVVYTTTAIAAFYLGMAALRLVVDERAFGDVAFGAVKTWILQTVLPFSFFIISYRSLVNLFTGRESRPADGTMESLET